jgi:hypothetical protein
LKIAISKMKFTLLLTLAAFSIQVASQGCECAESCIPQFDANGNKLTGREECAKCVCDANGKGSLVGNGNTKDSRVMLGACPEMCMLQLDANGEKLTGEEACAPCVCTDVMMGLLVNGTSCELVSNGNTEDSSANKRVESIVGVIPVVVLAFLYYY